MKTAAHQMTKEEAVLYKDVYLPAFIQKCASRGVTFETREDLNLGLETTALVKSAMAQQKGNQIKSANANLKKILGVVPVEAAIKTEERVKSAAHEAGKNPEVRAAVLAGLGLLK